MAPSTRVVVVLLALLAISATHAQNVRAKPGIDNAISKGGLKKPPPSNDVDQGPRVVDPAGGVPSELSGFVYLNTDLAEDIPNQRFEPVPTLLPLEVVDSLVRIDGPDTTAAKKAIGLISPILLPFPFPFPWWSLIFNNVTGSWSPNQTLCVKVNQAPMDILFLADTTGSMGGVIKAVQTAAVSMFTSLSGTLTNLKVGVSAYKDTGDTYVYKNFSPISSMTAASFNAMLTNWAASGGGDWPEANLYALQQAASSPLTGWRPTATKVIVWFGDAPGHDPSHLGVTLAAAQAALNAKGIKVIALDCSMLNYPYPTPQASTLASATGGYYGTVSSSNIAATMISTIANVVINIKPVVTCPLNSPFIIEVSPSSTTATALVPGCFQIRVKACNGTDCSKAGHYACTIQMVDTSNGNVISTHPILINTAAGTDNTAPVFTTVPPLSMIVECPNYYKCPDLTASDNCDGNWTVFPKVIIGGDSCKATQTCSWQTKDTAGNWVSTVQSLTVVDTTPPVMSPACAAGAICINPTTASPFCFYKEKLINKCFRDKCNRIAGFNVTCEGCMADATGTPPMVMECKDDADKLCIYWTPNLVKPTCCRLAITVTDICGNIATYFMKVCFVPPGTTSPYPCLNSDSLTGGVTVVDTSVKITADRLYGLTGGRP